MNNITPSAGQLAYISPDIELAEPGEKLQTFVDHVRTIGILLRKGHFNSDSEMVERELWGIAQAHELTGEPASGRFEVIEDAIGRAIALTDEYDGPRANGHDREPPPPAGPQDYGSEPITPVQRSETGKTDQRGNTPLLFVDMSTWRVDEGVPPREWGVLDLFPRRNVALLSGEGAAGKTLLLLQLGIAHALGRDWIGTLPEPGPFLYFGAEDETDEIHRRLADILRHYGVDFPDLQGKVNLLTFAGEDAVLGHADHTGLVRPTPLFERLLKATIEIRPVLIGIDTSADVFAGNENDRAQVRQFVGMLRKMAIQANAYIIVNSHPSLTGINTGTGLSGSTGWHNCVRARAYLTTAKTSKDEEEPDPNLRRLEFKKSNYGPKTKSIALRWDQGVYKPVAIVGSLDKMAAEHATDKLFLTLLDIRKVQGRRVYPNRGRGYAPSELEKMPEAKGTTSKAFEGAMERLFAANEIMVVRKGPPSKQVQYLDRASRSEDELPFDPTND
jgi:RecA-family ATPase